MVLAKVSLYPSSSSLMAGCAFVKMDSRASAQRAIDTLHNSTTMEGCRHPIVVKFAESEKEKMMKRGGMGGMGGFPGMPFMNPMVTS